MFAIPLAFDVIAIVLTTFKTYRHAAAVRRESGAVIVWSFPPVYLARFSDLRPVQLYTMLRDGILYVPP